MLEQRGELVTGLGCPKAHPLFLAHGLLQNVYHGYPRLPAGDRTGTGQIARFQPAVTEADLMAQLWTAGLKIVAGMVMDDVFVRSHRDSQNLQGTAATAAAAGAARCLNPA